MFCLILKSIVLSYSSCYFLSITPQLSHSFSHNPQTMMQFFKKVNHPKSYFFTLLTLKLL